MLRFWKKRQVVPPTPLSVEPAKPKPYVLTPATVGVPEGIYFVVYQNEFTDKHWCFGTSHEIAVIGKENSTLIFPVDRKTIQIEGKYDLEQRYYIPKIQSMKGLPIPLSGITPGLIAEMFLRKDPDLCVDRPTLWYETNLERVIWDSYIQKEVQPTQYIQ